MCANSEGSSEMRGCAGSREPSLVAYVTSTISHELAQILCVRTEIALVCLSFCCSTIDNG